MVLFLAILASPLKDKLAIVDSLLLLEINTVFALWKKCKIRAINLFQNGSCIFFSCLNVACCCQHLTIGDSQLFPFPSHPYRPYSLSFLFAFLSTRLRTQGLSKRFIVRKRFLCPDPYTHNIACDRQSFENDSTSALPPNQPWDLSGSWDRAGRHWMYVFEQQRFKEKKKERKKKAIGSVEKSP